MATNPIKLNTVTAVILLFIAGEALTYFLSNQFSMEPIMIVGITRLTQILVLVWLIIRLEDGLASIGWATEDWLPGLAVGAYWSMGFGVLTGITWATASWVGYNPLALFRADLSSYPLSTFFLVGGLIAPVFEEICFRGVIYKYMRQIGFKITRILFGPYAHHGKTGLIELVPAVIFAVASSTIIFAMLHAVHGLPITQIVGGLVFAIAYETSGNLMVPITIHVTGNLAIFSLSLLQGAI